MGPENRFPLRLKQVTEGCCGDAHASDSYDAGHATPTPPYPRPGWRPPSRPPAPRPHSPRLGPLALPPARCGGARGPRSQRQATGLARGGHRKSRRFRGSGMRRGRARAEGTAGPTLLSPQPTGFAAPRAPPTAAAHSAWRWGGSQGWGQEGWNPPLGLASPPDRRTAKPNWTVGFQ